MTSRRVAGLALLVVAAPAYLTSSALAGGSPPGFLMSLDAAGDSNGEQLYHWDWHGSAPVFGSHTLEGMGKWTGWSYTASDTASDGAWDVSWNVVFSGDTASGGNPFVAANIVVTNNGLFSDQFSANFVVNLDSPMFSPLMRGSISGTLSELTFDTANISAAAGGQIYTPRIDGEAEVDGFLFSAPFSESAGALQQVALGPESFGEQLPIPASRDAMTSIGILLDFNLSAGDSVALNAMFELMPLPGPGGLAVLAMLGVASRRRRR